MKTGLVHTILCSVAMFPALGTLCNWKTEEEPGNNAIAMHCQWGYSSVGKVFTWSLAI